MSGDTPARFGDAHTRDLALPFARDRLRSNVSGVVLLVDVNSHWTARRRRGRDIDGRRRLLRRGVGRPKQEAGRPEPRDETRSRRPAPRRLVRDQRHSAPWHLAHSFGWPPSSQSAHARRHGPVFVDGTNVGFGAGAAFAAATDAEAAAESGVFGPTGGAGVALLADAAGGPAANAGAVDGGFGSGSSDSAPHAAVRIDETRTASAPRAASVRFITGR